MDEGTVLHAGHEGVEVLRYVGDIRYTLAPSLQNFLDGLLAGARPAGFVVDLQDTTTIDSTNLGLLARLAQRLRDESGLRLTVICGGPDIEEILRALGLDEVFDLVAQGESRVSGGDPVVLGEPSAGDMARTVLEAHRALMALNERNRDQFRDVVALVEQQARDHDRER